MLAPFVARVIIANPLQVKAIAQAHVKTDKINAGTLASLQGAGYLPQLWTPDAETERKRRLVAQHLLNARGRTWLVAQPLPNDERAAIDRHGMRALRDQVPVQGLNALRS